MKKIRKTMSVMLVALMLLASAPLQGFVGLELPEWSTFEAKAADEYLTSGYCGEVTETTDGTQISWVLNDEGTLTITGEGRMAAETFNYDLRIKEIIIGEGVENIAPYAFNQCTNLTSVTVEGSSLTSVDDRAFNYCRKLASFTFPSSLETIGAYAFSYSDLAAIDFTSVSSLHTIEEYAFESCTKITSLEFPDSLKVIGSHAFYQCSKMASVTFPKNLESMGSYAFYACKSLTSVKIPSSIQNISTGVFYNCNNLTEVDFPDMLQTINSQAFSACNLTELVIPDSVTTIASNAFTYNSNLTSVTIGSGLSNLGVYAFDYCTNLAQIDVSDENETYSSYDGVLYDKNATALILVPAAASGEVTVPATVASLSYSAFDNCSNLTTINIEGGSEYYKSVDGIVYTADGESLIVCPRGKEEEVTVADGTVRISSYAFQDCEKITTVKLNDSLVSILGWAFYSSGVSSIEFGSSLALIANNAFQDCLNLTSLEISDSLKTIGDCAFYGCRNLTTVEYGSSLKEIGRQAFDRCNITGELIIPDSVTTIVSNAFTYNSNLTSVYIGSGLKTFGSNFSYCTSLAQIKVSEDNSSFSSCDGIMYNKAKTDIVKVPEAISGEITIPASVEEFTCSAINDCRKITALSIEKGSANYKSIDGIVYSSDNKTVIACPRGKTGVVTVADGVETIENNAFDNCDGLSNVNYPDSLTTIGQYAFYSCDGLTDIVLPDSLTTIKQSAFRNCIRLVNIVLPDLLTTVGYGAFSHCPALTTINIPKSITKVDNAMLEYSGFTELVFPESVQFFNHTGWNNLKTFTILNRYCEYTSTSAPTFAKDCTIRAYCSSPGHTLATKRLLNFESIGHTYLDWYVAQPATFEAEGIERRDCAYCDGYDERVIPKLESDVFTATFVAGGEVVATVDFAKGATEIAEPKVPAKDRYIGQWEEYTLADADITINAVYTLIKSEDASEIETESEAIHYTDKDDVLFRFKAWADALVVKSTVSKSVPLDIVLVVDQSGSMEDTLGGRTKKVDALKETAKDFVNTVLENAKITGADHRISLVGFGLSGRYQGFEKNENTELLTSANGIVKFDDIKTTDYASSLLSVNVDGVVNFALITAIDSIGARGATAADLGFEMAKGVFANTDSEGRQRVVVFMTDGEPTYLSGFQTSVANAAIYNASLLKNAYDASIYSVGVFSESDSNNRNINKFMNAVSSGYPDAVSMSYLGEGVDGQYYLTVNNTDSLTSVFKSISTESLSHTAPFDDLTVIKTLSEYVTLTTKQEEQLRIDLIRKYGITNDDIIITRNDDGTTTIQINGLTPYETTKDGEVIYEVSVEFFASLNEKAATAGDYIVDTEDSGVMLGEDAKGYEATFETSSISLTSNKTRVIFTVNGEVYEISEKISGGYAVIPEIEVSDDWSFSGWDTTSQKAINGLVLDATLTKADRTVIWHTADGDIIEKYAKGDIITAPEVSANANGDIFLSWDKSIPTTMPDENLEFTAVYGGHVHSYTSEVTKKMTCTEDGVRTYTCTCGDSYDEVITAIGHNYEAMTPSLEKEDAKCTFCCTNCGDKYDYALNYEVVESTGKKTRVLYEFNLTDDELNTDIQPDGAIQIRIPLSELHGSAEHVTVIRTNDDGSKTQVPAVHEKGFLIITCEHFTPYEVIFDIPCEGHIQGEWVIEKEATCTEEGLRYALCTECEKRAFEEPVAKLSHTESEWIIDEDSTCSKEGSKHKVCTACGKTVKTESIAKLDHYYNAVVTKATCEKSGYTTYTCECGDTYTGDQTPATGHNYVDGVCIECGNSKADNCSCNCHKGGFMGFIWKILCFFYKLFGMNKICACGVAHY